MADLKKPQGADDFVTEVYSVENEQQLLGFYQKWAAEYDIKMQVNLGYISPATVAGLLAEHQPDKSTWVLDVGCGTGLAGMLVHDQGFNTIDGLDLSADMVNAARQKDIYRQLFVADLNQPLDLAGNSYGAVVCTGTFTHGHVGPEPLDELFRVISPGGLLVCTVHKDLWVDKGFKPKFLRLEGEGFIEPLSVQLGAYYDAAEPEGWFCVYRKCQSES